jgi:hypothetical protein
VSKRQCVAMEDSSSLAEDTAVWDCSFSEIKAAVEAAHSASSATSWSESNKLLPRREKLAKIMLGIIPPCIGGDVQDWDRGDESETMVHNMVSTSVVHGSEMPINLLQLATLLPCSTTASALLPSRSALTTRGARPCSSRAESWSSRASSPGTSACWQACALPES